MIGEILSRYWWMTVLRGLFWILFGIVILASPGISLLSLTLAFGIVICADGIVNVANAFWGREVHEDWWVLLLVGLTGIVVDALTFYRPQATAIALVFYVAIWAIATGLLEITAAIRLRNGGSLALHRRLGFSYVGTFESVGFKLGRWVDTVLMQRPIGAGGLSLRSSRARSKGGWQARQPHRSRQRVKRKPSLKKRPTMPACEYVGL